MKDSIFSCCFEEGGGHLRRDACDLELLRKTVYSQPLRKWRVGPISATRFCPQSECPRKQVLP